MSFLDTFEPYELKIFTDGMRLPEIEVKHEDKEKLGLTKDTSNFDYLKKLAWNNCLRMIESGEIKQTKEECIERFKEEFPVLEKTGVADYFLFLRNLLLWCDDNNIPRGPSRGSCGGCFTAFCIGITYGVNPITYGLVFSRFLSEARAKPIYKDGAMYVDGSKFCDIDCDISQKDRSRVLDETARRYPNRTAKILTLQELTGKMAIKDVVKTYLEYQEKDALILGGYFESVFGKGDSIDETLEKSNEFKEWAEKNKDSLAISKALEGLGRGNGGVHASGVLCCYYPLTDILPLETSEKGIVSGYTMNTSLKVSLKIDLLGILTLDILSKCSELTGINYRNIDVNDQSIYDYYQKTDLFYGLFQISGGVTKEVVKKAKPKNISQLNATICIGRPGSIKEVPRFLKWLETGEKESIHPLFDEILSETGNIILFQESINIICQKIYKLSPVDADSIRAAIGKKKKDEMAVWEPIIKQKGIENGIDIAVTEKFFASCYASADYLFSKNHSQAYSFITAYTTYYKSNYPLQYFLACLINAQNESDPMESIREIQAELNDFKISLLPPNLSLNNDDFTIDGPNIRFGLSSIRGISGKNLQKIKNFRPENANRVELFESFILAKLPINVVTPLILSGCVARIDPKETRSKLLLQYELYTLLTDKEKLSVHKLAERYNYDVLLTVKHMSDNHKDEKGNFLIKPSRFATILKYYAPFKEKYLRNSQWDALTSIIAENEYLGFNYSNTLKIIYSSQIDDLLNSKELSALQTDEKGIGVFMIDEIEKKTSKKGNVYLNIMAKDEVGSVKIMMFKQDRIDAMNRANNGGLIEGNIIVAHLLHKDGSTFFADNIIKQDCPVVLKKSKIEKELAAEQSSS